MENKLTFLLVFLCFLLISIYLFTKSLLSLKKARQSKNWHKVDGFILTAVKKIIEDELIRYSASVTYEYYVKGYRYIGNNIAFGQSFYPELNKEAEKTLTQYPVGLKVDVYYDPSDPTNSVLQVGDKYYASFNLAISIALFILSTIMIYVWLRDKMFAG